MIFSTASPVGKALLLGKVSELDIFLLFCKNFSRFKKPFKSPILLGNESDRSEKSAALLPASEQRPMLLYDFRVAQSFTAINLARVMTGLNYHETIEYLCNKFGIISGSYDSLKLPSTRFKMVDIESSDAPCIINVRYEPWTLESIEYWKDYGWKPYMLDKAQIRPIQTFWLIKDEEYHVRYDRPLIGPISFSYDFCEVDGIFRRKIYNPKTSRKNLKWKNNTTKDILQCGNTIDYHVDTLYIVSSMKDCGPYWNVLEKPCAVAPNSESTLLSPEQINMIRQISDKQIIWFDNDSTGRHNAQKQANLYGFECKWNPKWAPKDQSDLVKEFGLKQFYQLINYE